MLERMTHVAVLLPLLPASGDKRERECVSLASRREARQMLRSDPVVVLIGRRESVLLRKDRLR